MKILKKTLIICSLLLIRFFILVYKIISNLWGKYNTNIKKFVINLDDALRSEL